ncbi:ABC transporter ATP-binding protein [Citricoccus sp. SGAir0253]|uniref:ABC transporter ATP-binding protein n=1 Tax=Citricoccus sp. SGAir0253 TaxID=2567881 RepID=UPI0010CD4B93|nr:ATP-binding cassette domain-containing protein [Citricoccus sp. SGAir0253]QCU78350.1 ABC transporter ATP-binding protein [Citricoccus sp. SGAir0253]
MTQKDIAQETYLDAEEESDVEEPEPTPPRILDEIAVVVDNVSMTYTVRSRQEAGTKKTLMDRVRGASGTHTVDVEALKPLSLVVHLGESLGVIGTNGSGKSTLMKLLTGRILPTGGSVHASSTPVMLGVNAALVQQISGRDNIILGCLAMGMTRAEADAKFDSIVQLSGLQDALHLPLRSYSSGMAARLQFAIATSVDPEILIIDEALNTGDAQFRARTRKRLDVLRQEAGCVFLVSHSLATIKEMCSRVIWLEKGELIMDGDPEEVTASYNLYTKKLAQNKPRGARLIREARQRDLVQADIAWT